MSDRHDESLVALVSGAWAVTVVRAVLAARAQEKAEEAAVLAHLDRGLRRVPWGRDTAGP